MGGMDGVALEGLGTFKGGVQHQVGGGRGETVDVDMHFHKAGDLACQTFQPFLDACLYGGFMLTPAGPKVLEFNARFGDPETQVVLPRLKNDLVEVMLACANCELDQIELDWRDEWAVAVVLTSAGYPGSYEKGKVITGIADAEAMENVTVSHAGTAVVDGQLVTNGGRVLAVTALGDTFENARNLAYEACEKIDFEGKTLRHDIGLRALRGRDAWDA